MARRRRRGCVHWDRIEESEQKEVGGARALAVGGYYVLVGCVCGRHGDRVVEQRGKKSCFI